MNKTIKASLIGAGATILAAIIGLNTGKSMEQKHIQNEINAAMGDMVNIIGDGNNVTINDIKELITDYQNLQSNNDSLIAQNAKYFEDLTNVNDKLEELQSNVQSMPEFVFNNWGLCIDGDENLINKNASVVTINGSDYFSKEIVQNLLSDNENMTIKNDTIFIGKVIENKADLLTQKIVDSFECNNINTIIDSYGTTHVNSLCFNPLCFNSRDTYIIFNLNEKYLYLDMSVSISEKTQSGSNGILIVKADDKVVYTSEQLSLTTKPFTIKDIPINKCNLLTISYNYNGFNQCILSDAIVYN